MVRHFKKGAIPVFAFAVSAILALGTVLPANAEETRDINKIVEQAQADAGVVSPTESFVDDGTAGNTIIAEDGSTSINSDGEAVAIVSEEQEMSLLIEDSDVDTTSVEDGMVVTESMTSEEVQYAISSSEDGSVAVHSILADHDAPTTYDYTFPDVDLMISDEETGQVTLFAIVDGEYEIVGGIDAPWAVDASGREVPTHYEIDGNTIRQVINHNSNDYAYPITADPKWWDNVAGWFRRAGSYVTGKAKSAARWLGKNSKWLIGKSWSGTKRLAKVGKVAAKKIGPWGWALCAVGAGWAWYRSDAKGWVRVGDAVSGCLL